MSSEYVFDTNIVINLFENYPKKIFPTFWSGLSAMILEGEIIFSSFTSEELNDAKHKDDDSNLWYKSFVPKNNIIGLSQIQQSLRYVLEKYPNAIDINNKKNRADPYVIAIANEFNSIIVTQEKSKKPRSIPRICEQLSIKCIKFNHFLEDNKHRFLNT